MRHWRKLAALLLAAACSGDATAPDSATVEPEPPAPPANRAPEVSGEIPAQSLVDDADQLLADVLAGTFTDPDGDSLWFDAESSDTSVVVAGCCISARAGGPLLVWLRPIARGGAAVTVTARDPDGLEARAVFTVEVTENPDRAALAALYEATDGPNWTDNENWLTDAPLGEWFGVTVGNHDGRITSLRLNGNALSGPIPPELGDLASLEGLYLYGENALSGPIPPELGDLASLEELFLSENNLSGPIPPEFGDLASLKGLSLSENNLSGPIPPELGDLASLEGLWLSENALSGPIPPEFGDLASLKRLYLFENALSGPIPPELGNLASLEWLSLFGNPELCAPADPQLRAWLMQWSGNEVWPCPDARVLPLALMRDEGNGLSLALPDDLHDPAVSVSEPGVVAATVADGWLVLEPLGIGRADVELVPSGGGSPAVAGVAVRAAVGTFGIDIVMEQPAPLGYEESMVAAADWWSSVLDGTEWEDRRPGCFNDVATALADELLIHAATDADMSSGAASSCFFPPSDEDATAYEPAGGKVWINPRNLGSGRLLRHEIGHILGLVTWHRRPWLGLTTEDGAYFTGPRAVEAYRAGGGDPDLPGVPVQEDRCWCHWHRELVDYELMGSGSSRVTVVPFGSTSPNALSLAALADAGYTVDMTKATPWPWNPDNAAAAAVAAEPFRERVEVRIVPRPVPE